MQEIILSKSGDPARIDLLDSKDVVDLLAVNDAARRRDENSAASQGLAFYQNLLMRVTGLVLGVRVKGVLVAHLSVVGPMELREAVALRHIADADLYFPHASLTDSVVVIGGFVADPKFDAGELFAALMDAALALPVVCVAGHVFAKSSVEDGARIAMMLSHQFGLVAAGVDSRHQQPFFVFQKPSFGFECDPWPVADEVDPAADFSAIVQLTQRESLVGFSDKEASGKFAFMRNRELLNLMPTVARVETR